MTAIFIGMLATGCSSFSKRQRRPIVAAEAIGQVEIDEQRIDDGSLYSDYFDITIDEKGLPNKSDYINQFYNEKSTMKFYIVDDMIKEEAKPYLQTRGTLYNSSDIIDEGDIVYICGEINKDRAPYDYECLIGKELKGENGCSFVFLLYSSKDKIDIERAYSYMNCVNAESKQVPVD